MKKTKILWSGITGRTGTLALKYARESASLEIAAGICRSDESFYHYDELDTIKEEFDVIVDFSHKDSFNKILSLALKTRKPLIIGTAKLDDTQLELIEEASKVIPVFKGGNFRFAVEDFMNDVVTYAKNTDEKEIKLVETHYKTKKVPSQTALEIKERVLKETGKNVAIDSRLEYDELINDWKVENFHCQVKGFDELAKDVLKIAAMMTNNLKPGFYDITKLTNEKENYIPNPPVGTAMHVVGDTIDNTNKIKH